MATQDLTAIGWQEFKVSTANATSTVCGSLMLKDDTCCVVEAFVIGRDQAGVERVASIRRALVYRQGAGGAVIEDNGSPFLSRTDLGMNIQFTVQGNDLRVEVVGKVGTNINWKTIIKSAEVS